MVCEVLNVMKQLANEGMTMVVVTHEMDLQRSGRQIMFMDEGSLRRGTPQEQSTTRKGKNQEFLGKVL